MRLALRFGLALLGAGLVSAAPPAVQYAPGIYDDFPRQLFWGDTHVHSSFSMDANLAGNARLTPADAYRFARGAPIIAHNGMTAKLDRPLDFLVVSDHAEYMGILPKIAAGDPEILADPTGRFLAEKLALGGDEAQAALHKLIGSLGDNKPIISNPKAQQSIWRDITRLADEHYTPGVFTPLIGYEWTSMPGGDNLHRVVIYGDGADNAGAMLPVSAFDGPAPEDLWSFMEHYEATTGGRILAIPHNGNVSNGRLFELQQYDGSPIDADYAKRRARHEPVVEVTQIKGDGETHPLLSPNDEFADFETWDKGNLALGGTVPKKPEMLRYEYMRSALQLGLQVEQQTGANPFQFGVIGSSDAHTALATADSDNFWGKATATEPGPNRARDVFFESRGSDEFNTMAWAQVASGYAAVWAHANTREHLFDAFRRREVYATTGPRIALRFFGGWRFEASDLARPDRLRHAYKLGVPMGAELPHPTTNAGPTFMIMASRDPEGANLDRIQVVKGWLADGELKERVYDVAAGGRPLPADGTLPTVPNTVDVATASYRNTVGAAQLEVVWQDPDFHAGQRAFYYVRVLQIPTPRWTSVDAYRLGADIPAEAPTAIQERAYSSPIWHTPIP